MISVHLSSAMLPNALTPPSGSSAPSGALILDERRRRSVY